MDTLPNLILNGGLSSRGVIDPVEIKAAFKLGLVIISWVDNLLFNSKMFVSHLNLLSYFTS